MAVTSLQFAGLTIPPAAALNAVSSDRAIAAAGARALVPLTYGRDRVSALILNVLVAGADSTVLLVQCLWGHACHALGEFRLNDQALPDGSVVVNYTGAQTTPDSLLVAAFAAQGITYTDTLAGFAYSVVAMPTKAFTGALDFSAQVDGRKVYDPRKDSTAGGSGAHRLATPSTWEWSDNPSLCLADWLASTTYGPSEPVLWSSVPAAADANDQTIGSPAEKRRVIGLTLLEPAKMPDLAEALRAYAGCWLVPTAGGMRLLPDADASAVAAYSHDSGQIAALDALVLRDSGNSPTAVEVVYTDASLIPYRDASAVASLPGAGSTLPWRLSVVRLLGIQRHSQALREATERLNKLTLADLTTTLEVFDVGIAHDLGDIITVTHPVGLVAKAMRISGIEMPSAGRWRLQLAEHDPLVYSSAVVTLATAPDTPRVAPSGPPADVTGLTGTITQGAIRWAWTQGADAEQDINLRIGAGWDAGMPLWAGRANGYTQLVDVAGSYTVWAKRVSVAGLESLNAVSYTVTLTSTDVNAPGSSQAVAYLYQWDGATQPGDPSGQTTYTWGTGANATYTGGNGWQTSAPANPGTPGARLWVASRSVVAPAGTVSSAVPWTSGFAIYAASVNGGDGSPGSPGAPGIKAATAVVYRWALSIPTISGGGTYTWAAADIGTPPTDWTALPGSGTPGQTLWAASVQLIDTAGATTSAISWTGASITPRGYAGQDGGVGQTGISARRAYTITTASSLGSGTVTTAGIASLPGSSTAFGSGLTWSAVPSTPTAGQVLYQSDGLYDPATDDVTWETPYISALKVGNLAALAVNTGALTVNDQLLMGSGGVVQSINYVSGPSGIGWRLTETAAELPASSIRGQLSAGQINATGLSIYSSSGELILNAGAGNTLATQVQSAGAVMSDGSNAPASILNSSLTGAIASAAETAVWTSVASRPTTLAGLDGTSATKLAGVQDGATVGAPNGTLVGGVASETVATGAVNGTSAYMAVNDANTGLAQRLRLNAQNVLAGYGGLATGTLTWNSIGQRTGGYGVGMSANGIAAYNAAGVATFSLDGGTGDATFAGTLNVASATSGKRIEMNSSTGIRVYYTDGTTLAVQISA